MTSPADGANGQLLPKGSIDQSIGWLIAGIGVIFFFLLTIFGMGRVEETTSSAVGHHERPVEAKPELEIVGVAPPQ